MRFHLDADFDADARHVVYTMPRSAFGGVVREILEMGLDVDMIVGGRGGRGGRGGKTKSRPSKAAQEHAQMWETVGGTWVVQCASCARRKSVSRSGSSWSSTTRCRL